MKIEFDYIEMSYFKGIRHLRVDFKDDVTNICGDNGVGKSSIADAVQWVLFGKNANGETKFSIKTIDDDGNVIPNVEHSVELCLRTDEGRTILKKIWVETRKVSRGEETCEIEHHAEYFINGERVTKKVYDQFIVHLVPEQSFRAATSVTYFFDLKWQEQRAILQEFADIDYSLVLEQNPLFKDVVDNIEKHGSLESYIKHLCYNSRLTQEQMKGIPPRIDELRRMMPAECDWDNLRKTIDSTKSEIDRLNSLINSTTSDASSTLVMLQKSLDFARRRKEHMEVSAVNMAADKRKEVMKAVSDAEKEVYRLEREENDTRSKIQSLNVYLARAKEQSDILNRELDGLRGEWSANEKQVFSVDESDLTCPMCGRPFDGDKKTEVITSMREKFNLTKVAKREDLRGRVSNVKSNMAEIDALVKTYEEQLSELSGYTYDESLSFARDKLEVARSVVMPTEKDVLDANPNYQPVCEEIDKLKRKIDTENASLTTEETERYRTQIASLEADLSMEEQKMTDKVQIEKLNVRIQKLEDDAETLRLQITDLMKKEDIAREYGQRCDDILSQSINKNFSFVKFCFFSTLNDGTRKPDCVALVDGIPYADANKTSKMNAAIDVMNALCRKNKFIAPVIIDNCESYNTIIPSLGQQVRLRVTNDKQLKIY